MVVVGVGLRFSNLCIVFLGYGFMGKFSIMW